MGIPNGVGLQVLEAMRGQVLRTGAAAASSFSFKTTQVIDSLNAFVKGEVERDGRTGHLCDVEGGEVTWQEGGLAQKCPIVGGTVEMFRDAPGMAGKYKQFLFNIDFRMPNGALLRLQGWKELHADGPVQILDALKDLSTLRNVQIVDSGGQVVATGELHVGLQDLVDQMQSLQVIDGGAKEAEAKRLFLAFMNGQLAEVYSAFPLFFHEDHSVVWRQYLLVQVLLDVFIPGPKAAVARDVIDELEKFLSNSKVALLDQADFVIRGAEQLFGSDVALMNPVDLRAWIRKVLEVPATNVTEKTFRDTVKSVHTMLVAAYYACAKVDQSIGYERAKTNFAEKIPADEKLALKKKPKARYDVVIIGSGVAGSLLAHRLAVVQKKSVCVLEAGRYHHERSFSSDEMNGMSRVYMSGGMQTATDPGWKKLPPHQHREITVLQPSAVGGGGLINNAVCFRMPKPRFDAWRNVGFPVEEKALNDAYQAVADELGIVPASKALKPGSRLNPMGELLGKHLGKPKPHPAQLPNEPGFFECNVNIGKSRKCTGCGYCNLGCSFEAKNNSLQIHLAEAIDAGAEVFQLAHVDALTFDSASKVRGALVTINGTNYEVKADEFVVACGPLHSSALLLRSGLGNRAEPSSALIGRRLSANIGAPVMAFLNDPIDSFGALQISHFYWPANSPGFAIESWFNPPAAQAMVIPGFFEDHRARMGAYSYLAIAAPLVGSFPGGSVDSTGKMTFPTLTSDLAKVHQGHLEIARVLFAGAKDKLDFLLMPTEHGVTIYDQAGLDQYAKLDDFRSIVIGTGHPQGGNGMSLDPQIGPVNEHFLLRGTDNLRVCDASIFPDCASINPQWTILALAHLCGEAMAS